ncbi:sensor histidine kinase [Helicovermis profundi]|uniref:histidine kinase n=1 Tax=Helicovermis profundi TaxID=3065157 RepID=A0AAU9E123_9FIRM|nr:sensor histidine kinase [Clostridia bacterium S502]
MIVGKKKITIIKLLVFIFLIGIGIIYENMSKERLTLYIIFISAFLLLNISKKIFRKKELFYIISFVIEILIIFLIEYYSRYYINYIFHSLYLITIIDCTLNLKIKSALFISILAVLTSLIKYVNLLTIALNFNTIAEMVFFLILSVLVVSSILFLKYYKIEKENKEKLLKELENSHKKLIESSKLDALLKLQKQRTNIAREIHDTLGHNMMATIMQLEMLSLKIDAKDTEAINLTVNIKKEVRESLNQVRNAVNTLKYFDINGIEKLIGDFISKSNVKIDKKIELYTRNDLIISCIYRIIQESLTNSIRHGNASQISINIIEENKGVNILIEDNGKVLENWEIGFGLKSMRERVLELSGYIEFESENGFKISGFIPTF